MIVAGCLYWFLTDWHFKRGAQQALLELHAQQEDMSAEQMAKVVVPYMRAASVWGLVGVLSIAAGVVVIIVIAVRRSARPAAQQAMVPPPLEGGG